MAKALKVEMQGAASQSGSYTQATMFFVTGSHLATLWQAILYFSGQLRNQNGRIQELTNPILLISGKNYKLQLRRDNPVSVIQSTFESVKFSPHLAQELVPNSGDIGIAALARRWLRLELEPQSRCVQNRSCGKETTSIYPSAMLSVCADATIEFCEGSYAAMWGLMYLQVYSVVKELFDASKVFPFMSKNLDALNPNTQRDLPLEGKDINYLRRFMVAWRRITT
ncbi:hypothetical protein V1504DRAFT_494874 [Lipomyces starkeyi]